MQAISSTISAGSSWVVNAAHTVGNAAVAGAEKVASLAAGAFKMIGQGLSAAFGAVQNWASQGLGLVKAHPQGAALGLGLALLVAGGAYALQQYHLHSVVAE